MDERDQGFEGAGIREASERRDHLSYGLMMSRTRDVRDQGLEGPLM